MKNFLYLVIILLLNACATNQFDQNVNCSPRALNFLKNENSEPITDKKSIQAAKEIMTNASMDLHKCYQEFLDKGLVEQYNVCVVLKIDNKGKILFLDVDDHNKSINLDLHSCIVKKFESTDFKKVKNKTTILVQPYNLIPQRK